MRGAEDTILASRTHCTVSEFVSDGNKVMRQLWMLFLETFPLLLGTLGFLFILRDILEEEGCGPSWQLGSFAENTVDESVMSPFRHRYDIARHAACVGLCAVCDTRNSGSDMRERLMDEFAEVTRYVERSGRIARTTERK